MVRNTGPEGAATMAASCLMRRLADAEEMVGPALFLASAASSFVTGTVLHADGGLGRRRLTPPLPTAGRRGGACP